MKLNQTTHHSSRTLGLLSVVALVLPLACGGTVEGPGGNANNGDGDGDSDSGDGSTGIGGNGVGSGGLSGDGDGDTPIGVPPGYGGGYGGSIGAGGGYAGGGYAGGPIGPGYAPEPLVGCETIDEYQDTNFCQIYRECDNGWSSAHCENYDGRNLCYCDNYAGGLQLEVDGADGNSCRQASALCEDFAAINLNVPEVCTPNYAEAGAGYCSLSEECRRTAEIDGINVSALGWREVWCDGGSCQCNAMDQNARIELPSTSASASTCNSVMNLCKTDAIAPSGMGVCQPRYQSAYQDSCEVELECAHTAALDGQTVNVFNSRYASCQSSGKGTYTCSCQYGSDPFVVDASSGWNACSSLAELCSF